MKKFVPISLVILLITNLSGCKRNDDVVQPPEISLSERHVNVSVYGESDGAIDLTVSGGVPPYTYRWSNGAMTEDLVGLTAGTYSITVTDAEGRTVSLSIEITQPWHLIIGTWDWIESNGMGGHLTPEIVGYTIKHRYSLDSILFKYKNDTLTYQTPYRVRIGVPDFGSRDTVEMLEIYNDLRGGTWIQWKLDFICTDTVRLEALFLDGGDAKYVRIRQR